MQRSENCTHSKEIPKSGKSVFAYHKGLLLKERISYRREQVLSFKRSPNFEKGRNS